MSRIAIPLWLTASAALTASMLEGTSVPARLRQGHGTDSCAMNAIGQAAAADTSRLRRVESETAFGKSAEGGGTTVYLQGDQPRVVVITHFGETGKVVIRYSLASPDQYMVEREEVHYARPISLESRPVIVSRLSSTIYVCGTTSTDLFKPGELKQIQAELDSTLTQLRSKQ